GERDDNGDGIPDWYGTGSNDKGRRLRALDQSWAIYPELIPVESRIPDQPDRRVPLRKIADPTQTDRPRTGTEGSENDPLSPDEQDDGSTPLPIDSEREQWR